MWEYNYRDYQKDDPLIKHRVESGKSIIGCEMHELNGWGEKFDQPSHRKRKGIIATILEAVFGKKSSH